MRDPPSEEPDARNQGFTGPPGLSSFVIAVPAYNLEPNPVTRLPSSIKSVFGRFPLAALLALVVLCLALKENYPFSHFPMYSSFTDFTFYVYLTDAEGDPIPTETITYIRTGKIKKIFDSELKTLSKDLDKRKRELTPADKEDAGLLVLRWYYNNAPSASRPRLDALGALELHQVDIVVADGEIVEKPSQRIARLELPPSPPQEG